MDNFWLKGRDKVNEFLNFYDRSIIETYFLDIWSLSPNRDNNYYLSKFTKVIAKVLNDESYNCLIFSNMFETWMSAWCNTCANPTYPSRLEILDVVDDCLDI